MDFKDYLCVDAENIQLINYIFTDQIFNENDYLKPKVTPVGGESSIKIFEQNGIPEEYQKAYMTCSHISMSLADLKNSRSNLYTTKFNRFKAKGYLTGTPIYLAISNSDRIFGQMVGDNPRFDVRDCYVCDKNEVDKFLIEIRKNGLLDNYLKAISEILQLNIKSYFDSNNKIKKKSK